jgi:uncharacterized protein (PEP-CTERM system associated)
MAFSGGALAQQSTDQLPGGTSTLSTPATVPGVPGVTTIPAVPGSTTAAPPGTIGPGSPRQAAADTDLGKPPPFYIQLNISSELTWTNNALFGTGAKQSDEILDITPGIVVHGDGANYRLDGNFYLDGVAYFHHTEPDRVLPRGYLLFNADLVQNLLYFDAGIRSSTFVENPFGVASVGPASTYNEYTTTQFRASPYIQRELTPDITLSARSDDSWTTTDAPAGFAGTDGFYGMQSVRIERRPEPLGWGVLVSQSDSRFQGESNDALKDDAARLSVNYSFDPVLLGLIAGYERAYVDGPSKEHYIAGVRFEWRPDLRTAFSATVEERYFGTGWNLNLGHREEDFALSANWSRDVTTYPTLLGSQLGAGFVPSLLDSVLSGEYTNTTARTEAVQNLLLTTGIPSDIPGGPSLVASAQALNVDTASVNAIFLGKFNTLAVTVYRTRTVPYVIDGEPLVLTVPGAFIDNTVDGATISLDHKLSPTLDVNATLLRTLTEGLGSVSGASSHQTSLVIQLNDRITPRTSAFLGVRHQILDSNLVASTTESAVFVGINHRF